MYKEKYTYNIDYTFEFDAISDTGKYVHFFDHTKDVRSIFEVSINDQSLKNQIQKEFPPVIADIVDLATVIHVADRLAIQKLDDTQKYIHLIVPIRNPDLFNTEIIQGKITYLLEWMTGSKWLFDFQKRLDSGRKVETQNLLFQDEINFEEVALWSGGLDALAGLYTRLKEDRQKQFLLFGTGSNNSTQYRQKRVYARIKNAFFNRINLCQVPINLSELGKQPRNKIFRARGLVFTLLGSACAYLRGQKALNVYENGVGAINLPYRKSAIGLDHSRSVHPLTLKLVSELISELIGETFEVQNPFLFWTKAQMCSELSKDKQDDLVASTMSCDSPHRREPTQCGYCSSCVLRKQSLAAAKIKDITRYIVPHTKEPVGDKSLAFCNMNQQVLVLNELFDSENDMVSQWIKLTARFPELDNIADELSCSKTKNLSSIQNNMIKMYKQYSKEWNDVNHLFSKDFLNKTNNSPSSVVSI